MPTMFMKKLMPPNSIGRLAVTREGYNRITLAKISPELMMELN